MQTVRAMSGHGDGDNWLSSWEKHCIDSIEEQPNYEQLLITDTDTSHRKIWIAFQDSATSIAQLYRGEFRRDFGLGVIKDRAK